MGATDAQQVEGTDVSRCIADVTVTDQSHKERMEDESETGGRCLSSETSDAERLSRFWLVRCNMVWSNAFAEQSISADTQYLNQSVFAFQVFARLPLACQQFMKSILCA